MSRITNRAAKDRQRRAKLRKRLQAAGLSEAEIERIIAIKRADDHHRRHDYDQPGPTREEILANTDDSLWPDDTGYRPVPVDPLLEGAARVNGVTAKVVRRRHTVTEYQRDRMLRGGDS